VTPRVLDRSRPLCAEEAVERGDPLPGTASRISGWLLVEYGGHWPYEPLDSTVFAGGLRERLAAQLAEVAGSRLFLVKRPGEGRRDQVSVLYGTTPGRFRRFELATHGGLGELDLVAMLRDGEGPGDPVGHPLLLVCAHGVRDRCCAKYGQELCRNLSGLAPDGWVWQTSHVGGDRFAGNLVILPEGLYFGRCDGEAAQRVLTAYERGEIDLDHYRGRSVVHFHQQAVDYFVRRELGLTAIDAIAAIRRVDGSSEDFAVDVTTDGSTRTVHATVARDEATAPTAITCTGPLGQRVPSYRLVSIDVEQPASGASE
jgi:hypothetical protein